MQSSVWIVTGVAVLAFAAGWLLRGLIERARQDAAAVTLSAEAGKQAAERAAERAVSQERLGRVSAELDAARAAAAAQAQAPEQVAEAMAPVQSALGRLERSVAEAEGGRAASFGQLAEQLRAVAQSTTMSSEGLRRETSRLVSALGRSEVRGRWGEFQLRRVLETSGLVRDVHFTEQESVDSEAGRLRPDVVLSLGQDKTVVVDAKVSLRAILGVTADDPDDQVAAARTAHAREVRNHVDRLAGKEYQRQFDSAPEFVVMFLPAESLLAEAMACDPGLLEHAFERNIVLATPTTLMALTRTVSHIWRQDALAGNAREIQALGRELAARMSTMLSHLDKVGASLGSSVTAYNKAVASLESRVLVTGRRFTELQGLPVELNQPRQVDQQPRSIAGNADDPGGESRDVAQVGVGQSDAGQPDRAEFDRAELAVGELHAAQRNAGQLDAGERRVLAGGDQAPPEQTPTSAASAAVA
ncbi:MAG: DNA recombination protein RmuC [Candidatus Nanopelagicales bacterium]